MLLLQTVHLFSTGTQPQCDSELAQATHTVSNSQFQTVRWRSVSSGPQLNAVKEVFLKKSSAAVCYGTHRWQRGSLI